MESLFQQINFSITEYFRFMDIFDILAVAYVIYLLIMLVKETRAEQLVKGIVFVLVVMQLSQWLQLSTIYFVLKNTMQVGVIAIIIVFQPELRRALEKVGRAKFNLPVTTDEALNQDINNTISQVCAACRKLSKKRVGALIVFERETKLADIIRTGIVLESMISAELLVNIFEPNTPLHDGAAVIRGNKIEAVACFLPITQNENLETEIGSRHRAGIGITENSDAVAVIVSEETGRISYVQNGKMQMDLTIEALGELLTDLLCLEKNGISFIPKMMRKH